MEFDKAKTSFALVDSLYNGDAYPKIKKVEGFITKYTPFNDILDRYIAAYSATDAYTEANRAATLTIFQGILTDYTTLTTADPTVTSDEFKGAISYGIEVL